MKKLLAIMTVLMVFYVSGKTQSEWVIRQIGICPTVNSWAVTTGDARNDGKERVYVSTRAGGVYEWSYNGSTWSQTTIPTGTMRGLIPLAIGDAHNDGKNRLYMAEWTATGKILEATFSNGSWTVVQIGTERLSTTGLIVGKIKNDNINRLYVNGYSGIKEYTWNVNKFDTFRISNTGGENLGEIGNGRNDNVSSLFVNAKNTTEYKWNGSAYTGTTLSADLGADATEIGTGRNDNVYRVYSNLTATGASGRVEFTYSGGTWSKTIVESSLKRGDICLARLKNDNIYRLYYGPTGSVLPFVEYTWNGSSYTKATVVDGTTGATGLINTGYGKNDDTIRMYTTHYSNGGVYEITNKTPYVKPSASIPVTGVTLNKNTTTLNVGNTDQLTATIAPANATNKNVNWTSSKNSVATVSSSGLITAVAAGNATITVTSVDGSKTDTCHVTVSIPVINVTGVSLNKHSTTLLTSNTDQLTATIAPANATNKNINWTSSKNSVATVSSSGLITAVAAGNATITVTSVDGNKTDTCHVTVTIPVINVTGVTLDKTSANIIIGGTSQLTATVSPANATNKNVIWTSRNNLVATVSPSGLITGTGIGNTNIVVTTVNGNFKDSCLTTIIVNGEQVNIIENEIEIYPNPANEEITIDIKNQTSNVINIDIFNTLGVVVYNQNLSSTDVNTNLKIDVHTLTPNIYFIVINLGGSKLIKKLVIE